MDKAMQDAKFYSTRTGKEVWVSMTSKRAATNLLHALVQKYPELLSAGVTTPKMYQNIAGYEFIKNNDAGIEHLFQQLKS